jgi:adenine-specific DNA-methyltransferase
VSRINDLVRQLRTKDEALAADLERELIALQHRRAFGLNFERHVPEAVELPGRKPRKGDKVRVQPPRGEAPSRADASLWRLRSVDRLAGIATLEPSDAEAEGASANSIEVPLQDVVVVGEFRDPIYPGLVSTGKVERGADKPFHTVINAENYHALETLLFTHRGKIDCIYIDPPYNTGAKDWKYNNDYVEADDLYRHSKWLAMMERRLLLAKELLDPEDAILIVTIDENELSRLSLLLQQTFPEAGMQLVTSVINRAGSPRPNRLTRVEEYLLFAFIGRAAASPWVTNLLAEEDAAADEHMPTVWFSAIRVGSRKALRSYYTETELFYPVLIDRDTGAFHSVGPPLPMGESPEDYAPPEGTVPVWPMSQGREQTWRFSREKMVEAFAAGTARLGRRDPATGSRSVTYLRPGTVKAIADGIFRVKGRSPEGALELELAEATSRPKPPATVWNMTSHYARDHGSKLLARLVPGCEFPFPKSLFAVEDTVRVAVGDKPDATVLDFFAGSGTTAHAVMRLNRQDGGRRRSISVTNNEIAADDERELRRRGFRPGDSEWEAVGICESVTKPRITAAVTGVTGTGQAVVGEYKYTDQFPIAEGLAENVEFFTLTYEAPLRVVSNREFERIAALLWMRAGARGRRITDISEGWDVAEVYGVLADLDRTDDFLNALAENTAVSIAYIVTDEGRLFEAVSQELPERVEPVRLYEAYLRNFEIESGRGAL